MGCIFTRQNYEGAEMLLGNRTVGRGFCLSMTEGNVKCSTAKNSLCCGYCCYSNSSDGEHYKKGTFFSRVIKLFDHKVQVTS